MENGWNVLGAMAALGAMAQTWRAQANLPNWAIYPILLVCAFFAQLLWGQAAEPNLITKPPIDPMVFARGMVEAWLVALGANRITSDAARGTPLQTRRTPDEPIPLKEA